MQSATLSLVLAGDSAGGGLALSLLSLVAAEARAGTRVRPAGVAVMSPWTDLALNGASMEARAKVDPLMTTESLAAAARIYLNEHDPFDPRASPLYADLAGVPPVRIHAGEDEVLLDDSIRYGGALGERRRNRPGAYVGGHDPRLSLQHCQPAGC